MESMTKCVKRATNNILGGSRESITCNESWWWLQEVKLADKAKHNSELKRCSNEQDLERYKATRREVKM